MSLLPFLNRVVERENLSFGEAREAVSTLLQGQATPPQIAAFLVALRMKGETVDELAGFASALRQHMIPVPPHTNLAGKGPGIGRGGGETHVVDVCGTGGDSSGTFNISTTVAFVIAGAGARVAKHGNRSISSASGSADVLEALGVPVTMTPEDALLLLDRIGITFLFAPAFHPAMKHVQPVRRELKLRTVFNLLGPLANPAGAQAQVIGTPSVEAAKLMAGALAKLGTGRAFVVHGSAGDGPGAGKTTGLDEISTVGETEVFEVAHGKVTPHIWRPAHFGIAEAPLEALIGGDAVTNAQITLGILAGDKGPKRDIVVVNAAAALVACGLAKGLQEGAEMAAKSIDSGAARQKLEQLRASSPMDQAQVV